MTKSLVRSPASRCLLAPYANELMIASQLKLMCWYSEVGIQKLVRCSHRRTRRAVAALPIDRDGRLDPEELARQVESYRAQKLITTLAAIKDMLDAELNSAG